MNRRHFLKASAGFVSQASMFPAWAHADPIPTREGLYTSRFTYRRGVDPIEIHASILDFNSVDITVTHVDALPLGEVVGVYTVSVDDAQTCSYPGVATGGVGMFGPEFPIRLMLDTQNLVPGLYEASIEPLVLRPENRENLSGSGAVFKSLNSICQFVVTAAVPGSHSNLLWIHDSLTGTAYGGFGEESIYGGPLAAGVRTVSYQRPGTDFLTRQNFGYLRHLRSTGYSFEFMDAVEFSFQPPSFVENYDLIVVSGQFEYLPHSFLANLQAHIAGGRRLYLAANEFAAFRVRLDESARTMTTFKWDAETLDPISGVDRAGIGMHNPSTIWETELAGLSVWGAHNIGPQPRVDMSVTNPSETSWLLEGTGFSDAIPAIISSFNSGNRGVVSGGSGFDLIDSNESRTPSDTVVWAATPSSDARQWDEAPPGTNSPAWPIDPDGHAICTWREQSNGARVIGLASQALIQNFFFKPGYIQLFENIMQYLTAPGAPKAVPSVGALGIGLVSAVTAETGRRILASASAREPARSDSPKAEVGDEPKSS